MKFARHGKNFRCTFTRADAKAVGIRNTFSGWIEMSRGGTFNYSPSCDKYDFLDTDGSKVDKWLTRLTNELETKYSHYSFKPLKTNSIKPAGAKRASYAKKVSAMLKNPVNSKTSTATRTATSTEAYTRGNVTVTGGAGAEATTVRIAGTRKNPASKSPGGWIIQQTAKAGNMTVCHCKSKTICSGLLRLLNAAAVPGVHFVMHPAS